MKVKDVMWKSAECVRPNDSIQEAVRKIVNLDVAPLPVCENDRIVGIITDLDIIVRGVRDGWDPKTTSVRDIMTSEIYCAGRVVP